jgi:hypothetical protein
MPSSFEEELLRVQVFPEHRELTRARWGDLE